MDSLWRERACLCLDQLDAIGAPEAGAESRSAYNPFHARVNRAEVGGSRPLRPGMISPSGSLARIWL